MRLARVRVAMVTVVVALLIGATVGPIGAEAASGGQLLAGPATRLVDGQPILVTGAGFAPSTTLHLYECRSGDCESVDASAVTDSSGGFATFGHVRRGLDAFGYPVDCAVTVCNLAVSSSTADASAAWSDMTPLPSTAPNPASVSLGFALRPTVSVVPNHRLADGQAVTVVGRDFMPGQTVYVYECQGLCTQYLPGSAVVDRNGRVSIPTTVRRWIFDYMASGGDLPMDCSVSTCSLTLALRGYYEDGYEKLAGAKLDFAPTPAIFTSGSAGPGAFFGLGRVGTWEGDTGTHPVEVRFGVTPSSHRSQVLRYTTYAWTATAADFQPIEGVVTLPPGATEGSVTVDARSDTEVEKDEVFLVEFRGTRRLSNSRGVAVVQIQDNDRLG